MRTLRALGWRWLATGAVGAVVGVLLVGAAWYASTHALTAHALTDGPLGGLVGKVAAQEAATPTPGPSTAPARSGKKQQQQPANTRRPTGEVVQIATDPPSFTIRTSTGAETTYQVLDTTVFMAGHDRPYRFDLLTQGDRVIVRGGGADKASGPRATASPVPARAGPGKRPNPNRPNAAASGAAQQNIPADAQTTGQPIARIVIVRPAGEKPKKQPGQTGLQQPGRQQPGPQQAEQPGAAAKPHTAKQKGVGNGAG